MKKSFTPFLSPTVRHGIFFLPLLSFFFLPYDPVTTFTFYEVRGGCSNIFLMLAYPST